MTVLREENATVLPFRDAVMRRPIDVVAWMNSDSPLAAEPSDASDNVIQLARFARSSYGARRRMRFWDPPEGDAA
jgi:hypothetical protein